MQNRQIVQILFFSALSCAFLAGCTWWAMQKDPNPELPTTPSEAYSGPGPSNQISSPQQAVAWAYPSLVRTQDSLNSLQQPLAKPGPSDWLAQHRESGQTFRQYVNSRPSLPRGKRTVLYIQPIGTFTPTQRKVVDATVECMKAYFQLEVRVLEDLPEASIPETARRINQYSGQMQVLTTHILYKVLKPNLPDDAACLLGLSAPDLWPGRGWNFVFGQASLRDRVGVWSMARNGNPEAGEDAYRLYLLRTLKTATHETGHMFSIQHCIAWECNMCGSNHRGESDRHPFHLCSECMPKICWASQVAPEKRYKDLLAFCDKHKLEKESHYYREALQKMSKKPASE